MARGVSGKASILSGNSHGGNDSRRVLRKNAGIARRVQVVSDGNEAGDGAPG
jgi:hypothetical protein